MDVTGPWRGSTSTGSRSCAPGAAATSRKATLPNFPTASVRPQGLQAQDLHGDAGGQEGTGSTGIYVTGATGKPFRFTDEVIP